MQYDEEPASLLYGETRDCTCWNLQQKSNYCSICGGKYPCWCSLLYDFCNCLLLPPPLPSSISIPFLFDYGSIMKIGSLLAFICWVDYDSMNGMPLETVLQSIGAQRPLYVTESTNDSWQYPVLTRSAKSSCVRDWSSSVNIYQSCSSSSSCTLAPFSWSSVQNQGGGSDWVREPPCPSAPGRGLGDHSQIPATGWRGPVMLTNSLV